jgi:hypothetical protein
VLVALQQALHGPGVERRRLTALLGRLSQPLLTAPVKELKRALARYQRDGDTLAFVETCDQVAADFAQAPAAAADRGPGTPHAVLGREDLRLVCFEFLSG